MGPALLAALVVTEVFGGDRALVLDERSIGVGAAAVAPDPAGPHPAGHRGRGDGDGPGQAVALAREVGLLPTGPFGMVPAAFRPATLPRGTGTHRSHEGGRITPRPSVTFRPLAASSSRWRSSARPRPPVSPPRRSWPGPRRSSQRRSGSLDRPPRSSRPRMTVTRAPRRRSSRRGTRSRGSPCASSRSRPPSKTVPEPCTWRGQAGPSRYCSPPTPSPTCPTELSTSARCSSPRRTWSCWPRPTGNGSGAPASGWCPCPRSRPGNRGRDRVPAEGHRGEDRRDREPGRRAHREAREGAGSEAGSRAGSGAATARADRPEP